MPPPTGVMVTTARPARSMRTRTRLAPAAVTTSPPGIATGKSPPVTDTVGAARNARYWASQARPAAGVVSP